MTTTSTTTADDEHRTKLFNAWSAATRAAMDYSAELEEWDKTHPRSRGWAERIRKAREARGLTKTQLARLAGVTVSTVTRAEKGRANIKLETVHGLAQALGTTMDDLLIGPRGLGS